MSAPLSKLGLGAAQFRFDGPAARGRAPEAEVGDILSIAARSGLTLLDASTPYGHAEQVMGERMPRPTPFRVILKTARADRGPDYVETEARASLRRLGLERAYAIVVQSAGDLFGPHGGALWDRLLRLRDLGLFERVGVSACASDDPLGLTRRFKPDIVQAPASLLDQRLLADGSLATLADWGVEVQLRSIFLQGLLFLPADRAPGAMKGAATAISRVRRMIAEGRSDPLQAALGFALSRPEASSVIVGVTSAAELSAVVAAAQSPPPELDWDRMAVDDPAALDPDRWVAA
ncbi:bifunctional regulator KidO [Caulobacter sp. CCUG 60055]|nr:aldo/keto reductase [Caulobacter sp. CCUG 60055]MCI3181442.1 bifunctional regulator KidO [Caulobacter sp. CCUG 60055]